VTILLLGFAAMSLSLSLGCAPAQPPDPTINRGPRDVVIFVHLVQQGSACRVAAGKEPVRAHKNDKVVWEILNDCQATQEVTFHKFKRNNQDDDPTDTNVKKRSVRGNGGSDKLKVGIRQISASGVRKYKYNVLLDSGFELDPELEVEY
jgi:hypothetical protein